MAVIVGAWWGDNRPDQLEIRDLLDSILAECTDVMSTEQAFCTLVVGRRPCEPVSGCESVWMCDGMIAAGRIRSQSLGTELDHSSDFSADFKTKVLISNGRWLAENVWGRYVIAIAV